MEIIVYAVPACFPQTASVRKFDYAAVLNSILHEQCSVVEAAIESAGGATSCFLPHTAYIAVFVHLSNVSCGPCEQLSQARLRSALRISLSEVLAAFFAEGQGEEGVYRGLSLIGRCRDAGLLPYPFDFLGAMRVCSFCCDGLSLWSC